MNSEYTHSIERKIRELIRDYSKKGYRVITEPNSNLIPRFLENFRPDIIALSNEDNVVIEIKSSGKNTDFKKLEELANIVNSMENWRFELVFTNPKNRINSNNQLIIIDNGKITERVATVKRLLNQNSIEPAFLIGWATLEASIRNKLKSINIKKEIINRPSLHIIKNLFSFGLINHSTLRKLENINNKRNKLIHGFESNISYANINEVLEVIELLTGTGDSSEIYDWLSFLDLEYYDDIHSLYRSVSENDDYGMFSTTENNNKYYVKSDIADEVLELKNKGQKDEMLEIIVNEYMGEMDPEGFYSFHRAMEKDD